MAGLKSSVRYLFGVKWFILWRTESYSKRANSLENFIGRMSFGCARLFGRGRGSVL